MYRILILALVLLSGLLLYGCGEDEENNSLEEFIGTYMADDDTTFLQEKQTELYDSVVLIVRKNTEYSVLFLDYSDIDEDNYCNTSGKIDGFGSNSITFYPFDIDSIGSSCDRLRIPSGLFEGNFTTRGDTIYISKYNNVDKDSLPLPNSVHRFVLLKQ